jgi:predicted metal-dependent hydrolase
MWFVRRRRRVRRTRSRSERVLYETHKERARMIIHERVFLWAPRIGVTPGRIAIRDQRSRWGSCSTKGNLNFNYRIVFLPIELIDYVVVHELCHLHEFNHSKQFWAHVSTHLPEYHLHKEELHRVTHHDLYKRIQTGMVSS